MENTCQEKLEKLCARSSIKPVDMTKFSSPVSREQNNQSLSPRSNISARQQNISNPPTAEKQRRGRPTDKSHGSGMTLTENRDMNGFSDATKKNQSGNSTNGNGSKEMPLIENIAEQTKLLYANVTTSENSLNQSWDTYYSNEAFHSSFEAMDVGPHREMAVDCPENFVGRAKSAPRYPPPPPSHTPPRKPVSSPQRLNQSSRENLADYKNLGESRENLSDNSTYKNIKNSPIIMTKQRPPTQEELERVRKHEEYLKKRREDETRIQREHDFLRNSLRESQRLQSLENKQKNSTGIINNAFEPEILKDEKSLSQLKGLYMTKNLGE